MPKKRLDWIDISKGIAILATVVGHVSLLDWDPIVKIIFSFHMPLFFVVAGHTSKPNLNRQTFKKLFTRIFLPYIVLSLFMLAVRMLQGSDWATELLRIVWGSGVGGTYGPGRPIFGPETIPTVGMIWFFPCLFFTKILFSLFLKATQSWKEWMRAPVILGISAVGYLLGQAYKLPLCFDTSVFAMLFFYAGYCMKTTALMEKPSVTMGIGATVFWYLALRCNALEMSARIYRAFPACIFTVFGAIAASYCVFQVSNELLSKIKGINRFLIFCGKHSMTIFCIHYLESKLITWTPVETWFTQLPGLPAIVQALLFAAMKCLFCTGLCFLYVLLKEKVQPLLAAHKIKQSA